LALERAKKHGIDQVVVELKDFSDKGAYERKILEILRVHAVDLVCLAGYMKIVGPELLNAYKGRMMNIHPALLPAFPGLDVQQKAL